MSSIPLRAPHRSHTRCTMAGGEGDDNNGVVRDSRFKTLHNDPRFMNFPTNTNKTKIDGRFKKMFSDPNFGTGKHSGSRDKRGRKTEKAGRTQTGDDLKQYYDLEDEGDGDWDGDVGDKTSLKKSADAKKGKAKKASEESDKDESEDSDASDSEDASDSDSEDPIKNNKKKDNSGDVELDDRLEASRDRMRGVDLSESESDDESDDDDTVESDSEGVIPRMLARVSAHGTADNDDGDSDDPDTIDATHRIAIVDQEWQHLRALDLLVVLRSFAPKSGEVKKVTVYPSDFGLKRMKEETKHGPLAAFGKTVAGMAEKEKESEKKSAAKKNKKQKQKDYELESDDSDLEDTDSESEEDPNVSRERMRKYERDRMTYYYAICECDSSDTAHAVYTSCDGLEFERSANKLELRYVPDKQDFSMREIRDEAKSVPSDYEPPEFQVKALQQTNVKLSWDLDDPARKKAFSRKLTEDKLKDEDFAAYMASESDEDYFEEEATAETTPGKTVKSGSKGKGSDADQEKAKRAYLAKLIGGGDDEKGESSDDDEEEEEGDHDDEDDNNDADPFKRASWGSGNAVSVKNRFGDKSKRGKNGDMEVTFHSGLEELGAKMKRRKDELADKKSGQKGETVWEKHLREKSEKRSSKKLKDASEKVRLDDMDNDEIDDGFDDDFFADGGEEDINFEADGDSDSGDEIGGKSKKKKSDDVFALDKKESKKEKKRRELAEQNDPELLQRKADLELLMMDDEVVLGGSGKKSVLSDFGGNGNPSGNSSQAQLSKKKSRKARLAEKKAKNGKAARQLESDDEDDGGGLRDRKTVDVADDRFAGLFDSHKFALDPTDPRYKETKAAEFIAEERARRRDEKKFKKKKKGVESDGDEDHDLDSSKKSKKSKNDSTDGGDQALRALVSGLKRKSAAALSGSGGKRR